MCQFESERTGENDRVLGMTFDLGLSLVGILHYLAIHSPCLCRGRQYA